jgi:chemotaxis methyl-accepting protein methylase
MAGKLKNIIEDIALDHLNNVLAIRYDICTCAICKNDMLALVLSRVPAQYVTTEEGALHTIIQQFRVEYQVEIARAIIEAINTISKNPRHELKENKNQTFQLLLDKVQEDRSLDFHHYNLDLLKRRVAIRLRKTKVSNYSEYLLLLMKNPEEYDRLFETLCINVSEFFRDPEVWQAMRPVFLDQLRQKANEADNSLRVWSAGCANGEEPYSIALLIKELLSSEEINCRVEILATDVEQRNIKLAHKGVYLKTSLKNVSKALLNRYFTPAEEGFKLNDAVKQLVNFSYLDLTSNEAVKNADIICCRNVFIYFDRDLQEQLLMKFYNSLKPKGYLLLGKSETLIQEAKEIFENVDINSRLFRKN